MWVIILLVLLLLVSVVILGIVVPKSFISACRFCATARCDQIQLGPCCEAKISNAVKQPTLYTIPDPGPSGKAAFILSESSKGQTINGNAIVTYSNQSVTQQGSLSIGVEINGIGGAIQTVTASPLLSEGLAAKFTVSNSAVESTSRILVTIDKNSDTKKVGNFVGLPSAYVDNIVDGAFDIILFNSATIGSVNGYLVITFVVLPS